MMPKTKKISENQSMNLLDFAERGFVEGVSVDFEGKSTTKYSCNLCDYKNKDKGGMKRHIHAKHRADETLE